MGTPLVRSSLTTNIWSASVLIDQSHCVNLGVALCSIPIRENAFEVLWRSCMVCNFI